MHLKKAIFNFFLVFVLLIATQIATAQTYALLLRGADKDSFIQKANLALQFSSFVEANTALKEARLTLHKLGYLAASIDSLDWSETAATAHVTLGKSYQWGRLSNKNIPISILNLSKFNEKQYLDKTLEIKKLIPPIEKILKYMEQNGFPFASISFDSIRFQDNKVHAQLALDKGPFIKLDSIRLNDDVRISRSYVLHYLGLKQGMPYNEEKIRNISARIRELPFLSEAGPWRVQFASTKTEVNMFLKNKSANRADVLLGLLPNNVENGGKLLLTGDVKLAFLNALGYGERLELNWQNLQVKSPRYNLLFQIPYMLNSSVGLSGRFDFYKKDTTFRTVNGELGLTYQLSANEQIKVYYELANSRLGTLNKTALIANRRLPDHADVSYKTVGAETNLWRVDYRLNPRKGYRILLNAGISFRTFQKNTDIENTFDPVEGKPFSYLYDSIELKSFKYNLYTVLSHFLPLSKRFILNNTLQAGITYSTKPLYKNELFQIGGYRILRGFDEGSLFVNNYAVYTLEPRYILSTNSYFFLFTDLARIQANYAATRYTDFTYSIGLGMSFETRAGLFNISYATGASNTQAFQLRNSKVHFGYINFF